MSDLHPDAAAIDRLGRPRIRKHFGISDQGISYWRRRGVPSIHRATLALLGRDAGIPMPEMAAE